METELADFRPERRTRPGEWLATLTIPGGEFPEVSGSGHVVVAVGVPGNWTTVDTSPTLGEPWELTFAYSQMGRSFLSLQFHPDSRKAPSSRCEFNIVATILSRAVPCPFVPTKQLTITEPTTKTKCFEFVNVQSNFSRFPQFDAFSLGIETDVLYHSLPIPLQQAPPQIPGAIVCLPSTLTNASSSCNFVLSLRKATKQQQQQQQQQPQGGGDWIALQRVGSYFQSLAAEEYVSVSPDSDEIFQWRMRSWEIQTAGICTELARGTQYEIVIVVSAAASFQDVKRVCSALSKTLVIPGTKISMFIGNDTNKKLLPVSSPSSLDPLAISYHVPGGQHSQDWLNYVFSTLFPEELTLDFSQVFESQPPPPPTPPTPTRPTIQTVVAIVPEGTPTPTALLAPELACAHATVLFVEVCQKPTPTPPTPPTPPASPPIHDAFVRAKISALDTTANQDHLPAQPAGSLPWALGRALARTSHLAAYGSVQIPEALQRRWVAQPRVSRRQTLAQVVRRSSSLLVQQRGGGGRDEDARRGFGYLSKCTLTCSFLIVLISFIIASFASVEQLYFGVPYNRLTLHADYQHPREPGLHFIGPFTTFIELPSTTQSLILADNILLGRKSFPTNEGGYSGNWGIRAKSRDGATMYVNCALRFNLDRENVGHALRDFLFECSDGNCDTWTEAVMFHVRRTITARVSDHVTTLVGTLPITDMWLHVDAVVEQLSYGAERAVNELGFSFVAFEFFGISVPRSFEKILLNTQIELQHQVRAKQDQQVELQQSLIQMLRTEAAAEMKVIDSEAQADAKRIVGDANRLARFQNERARVEIAEHVKKTLGLTTDEELSEFLRFQKWEEIEGAVFRIGNDLVSVN